MLRTTIDLVADKPINYGQWNTFSLNLTDLVKTEPGAIYRVEMNFRQSQSLFPCADQDDVQDKLEAEEDFDSQEEEDIHQSEKRILTVYNQSDKEICWFDYEETMAAVGEAPAGERKEAVQKYILSRIPKWVLDL